MEYTGKLYGRIGNKHFDTGHTAKDWDELIKQVETLKEQLSKEQKLPVDLVIKSYSEKNMDDAYDKGYNDGASAAATDIMNSL